MNKNSIKIFHIADMQYEIRVMGEGGQRYEEFSAVNHLTLSQINIEKPDVVVIAGDVFQFESTTAEEDRMFGKFLNDILAIESVKRIIIIDGNHDVKQRVNHIYINGKKENMITAIESVVANINNPRISYYKHTGIYKDSVYPLHWAVWSQLDKWSAKDPKPAYSPWVNNPVPNGALIELYHDPISNCVGFDGRTNHADYQVNTNSFKANVIIAGDIHAPAIIWSNDRKLFTYSSSLIMRNFGEGDYFRNNKLVQTGNQLHGYNIINFDLDNSKAIDCNFFPVKNPVNRTTIYIDKEFKYTPEYIKGICSSIYASDVNMLRLVAKDGVNDFVKNQQFLVEEFGKNLSNLKIEFEYEADILDYEIDETAFDDLEQIVDKSKILEISKNYINNIVSKTSTIADEDKEETEKYLFQLLSKALNQTELSQKSQSVKLIDFEISNFMKLGDTKFVFTDNGISIISGTNRVGKTTIKHLINFTWTDQISHSQDMRNKKYNYLQYFNTDLPDSDEINIKHRFLLNNSPVTITKKIERVWKKGKRDPKAKDILSCIKDINVELIVKTDSEELVGAPATEFLNNIITFDALQKIGFVGTDSIQRLVETSTQDMAHDFLDIMGLNISEALENGFDALKESEMVLLSKPSMTIPDIIASIDAEEISINIQKKEIDLAQNSLKVSQDNLEKLNDDIQVEMDKLHKVDNFSKYVNDHTMISNSITNKNQELSKYEIDKNELINSDELNINDINSRINEHHAEINSINSDINKLSSEINNKNSDISNQQNLLKVIAQEYIDKANLEKDKYTNEITELNQLNDVDRNKIFEIKQTIEQIINSHKNKISEEIQNKMEIQNKNNNIYTEKNAAYNQLIGEINNIDFVINSCTTEKEKLELSLTTECNSCGQLLQGNAKEKVQNSIVEKEREILELTEKKSEIEVNTKNLQDEMVSINTENGNISNTISELRIRLNQEVNDPEIQTKQVEVQNIHKQIEDRNIEITNKNQVIGTLSQQAMELVKQDTKFLEGQNLIETIKSEISNIEIQKQELDNKLPVINQNISVLEQLIEKAKSKDIQINELTEKIVRVKEELAGLTKEKEIIIKNMELARQNERSHIEIINPMVLRRNTLSSEISEKNNFIQNLIHNNTKSNFNMEKLMQDLENAKKYKLFESSFKLYKRLVGKNGLPQFVFAHLIPLINNQLNSILSDVDFRLLFDQETLELRFHDLEKQVSRPISFCSGMERTVLGLAITNIRRILNHSKRFDFLFIDEISGTLNDGNDLEYEAKNNQEIVKTFIERVSLNVPIYIVDHILHFKDARIITVKPTETGSVFLN